MNLSVLVIESSVASTNQIARGMLLALIKFVKFTLTNQIRYSLRADQRKTGVTLLLGIFQTSRGEIYRGNWDLIFSATTLVMCSTLSPFTITYRSISDTTVCFPMLSADFGRIRLCSHIRLQTWRVWCA